MKKRIALILALLVLFIAPSASATALNRDFLAKPPVSDIAEMDGVLYAFTQDWQIVSISSPDVSFLDDDIFDVVVDLSDHPDFPSDEMMVTISWYQLVSDGEKLYLADFESFTLYEVVGNELKKLTDLHLFDATGPSIATAFRIYSVFMQDNFLYVINKQKNLSELYRISIIDGSAEMVLDTDDLYDEIIPYKDGKWLAKLCNVGDVYVLNPSTFKKEEQIIYNRSPVSGLAYDAVNDNIYYTQDTDIYRWEKDAPVQIERSGIHQSELEEALIWQSHYVTLSWDGMFVADTTK